RLTIFGSGVPPILGDPGALNRATDTVNQQPSDMKRVIYWLGDNGGLYRQERPWITADGVGNAVDPDSNTSPTDLLSEDVKDLAFSFYDGSTWADTWTASKTSPL